MREGTNERTYTMTKHITTLLLRSPVKRSKSLIYKLTFSIIVPTADKIQRNYIFAYVSISVALT